MFIKIYTVLLSLIVGLSSSYAYAEGCEEAWFIRNFIMHNAGYCFSSALGVATFGNDNCTTKSPKISSRDQGLVEQYSKYEKINGCRINTNRTAFIEFDPKPWLKLDFLPKIKQMSENEASCHGFQKSRAIPLYNAPSSSGEIIGYINLGDDIYWSDRNFLNWDFVYVGNNLDETWVGWTSYKVQLDDCFAVAG